MANALKEISASLREAVRRASVYTVSLEREPYAVSGVLIGGDRVLTASHLVPDEGIVVVMPDGKKHQGKVAGRDPIHDLALLRLGAGVHAPAPVAASVAVGDLVVTLKRDSFDGINAALGMVSAAGAKLRLGRNAVLERYVQTDSDRMTGSTGGPLADADGAFAGIQVFNRRMGAEVAIPADLALARARLLEEKGSVQRPYLGVKSQAVALSKVEQDGHPFPYPAPSQQKNVGRDLEHPGFRMEQNHPALLDLIGPHHERYNNVLQSPGPLDRIPHPQ